MNAASSPRATYRFDRFTLNLAHGVLRASDGTELPLRPKSFALLQLFVENAGHLLDRDSIMAAIWPDVFVTDDSITQCVGEIRRALGEVAPRLLQTLPRRGYRFTGEVACADAKTDDAAVQPHLAQERIEPPGSPPSATGERRQLTVLFGDLVGSTALAERLDPEDVGEVLRAYQECCTAAIVRLGGHVARYLGDGVLAYFGYPRAQEDAAERAVRAGLAIVEATDRLPRPGPGPTSAGAGRDRHRSGGERPARRRWLGGGHGGQAAAPGRSAAGARGARHGGHCRRHAAACGRAVRAREPGPPPSQGLQLTRAGLAGDRRGCSRESLRGAAWGKPCIPGRPPARSSGSLLDRWEQAKEGEGQLVLLAGEAGIGKSRLVRALREELGKEPHTVLSHHGSPQHTNTALHPVIGYLERASGLRLEKAPDHQFARLEALLACPPEDGQHGACAAGRSARDRGRRPVSAPGAEPAAEEGKDIPGPARPRHGLGGARAGAGDLRRRALGGPDDARVPGPLGRPGAAPAGAGGGHLPPGVRATLERLRARHDALARTAWSTTYRGNDRAGGPRQDSSRSGAGADPGQDRWGTLVRRGAHQDASRVRRAPRQRRSLRAARPAARAGNSRDPPGLARRPDSIGWLP